LATIAKGALALDNGSTGALFKENSLDLRGSAEREPMLTLPTKGSTSPVVPLRTASYFAATHPYILQRSARKDLYEDFFQKVKSILWTASCFAAAHPYILQRSAEKDLYEVFFQKVKSILWKVLKVDSNLYFGKY
jgi:hypothetical protein